MGHTGGGLLVLMGPPLWGSVRPLLIKSLFAGGIDLSFRKYLFPSLLTGKRGWGAGRWLPVGPRLGLMAVHTPSPRGRGLGGQKPCGCRPWDPGVLDQLVKAG